MQTQEHQFVKRLTTGIDETFERDGTISQLSSEESRDDEGYPAIIQEELQNQMNDNKQATQNSSTDFNSNTCFKLGDKSEIDLRKIASKLVIAQGNVLALKPHEINLIVSDKPSINVAIVMDAVMTLLGLETGWPNVIKIL